MTDLTAIISPYPTRQNSDKMLDYILLTKNASTTRENEYPIHLTELSINDTISKRRLYHRETFTLENTAINWINVVNTLVVYDDFGIDDFMQAAINLAKEKSVTILYSKCRD